MSLTDVSNISTTEFFEEFFRLSKRKLAFGCLVGSNMIMLMVMILKVVVNKN